MKSTASARGSRKLDAVGWGVNLATSLAILAGAACGGTFRSMPVSVLAPSWPTYLGTTTRAPVGGRVRDEVEAIWRADVGTSLTAPIVAAGPVLLATPGNRLVAAISAEDGDAYWERRLDGPAGQGVVHNGRTIYVATELEQGRVVALEATRGRREWQRRVGAVSRSLLILGDTLIVATDGGALLALDARSGDERWRTRLPAAAAATPVPWGADVLVATVRDSLFAVERAHGRVRARVALPATVSAPPALRGDTLLLPLHSGELLVLALPGLEEIGRAALGAPILASPTVTGDGSVWALTRDADVWRLDAATPGAAQRVVSLGGVARASLATAGDRLLVGRLDGALFLLRADGTVVWRENFDDSIHAPVTVGEDGSVYVPLVRGEIVKLR